MSARLSLWMCLPLLVTVALVGCSGASEPIAPSNDALWAQYRAAIADARVADAADVSAALTPLAPGNDALRWRHHVRAPGDTVRQVRVVTWRDDTPLPGAAAPQAEADTLTLNGVVWVTPVPALRRFCQALDGSANALDRRLRQRLGLPPDFPATRMVEVWVDVADLVRPCPDPATTDRTCSRVPPQPARLVSVDSTYRAWFRELKATSYGANGYPWTRLGYTYDWNPQTDAVGPSEFVVWPPARVQVHAVMATAAYCQ